MASIQITGLVLADALNYTSRLTLHTTKFSEKANAGGRVQTYASGRQRAVTSVGIGREVACQLTLVSPADMATLSGWIGRTLLLRDSYGWREWVTFFDFQRDQQPFPALSDVSLTFRVITFVEAV